MSPDREIDLVLNTWLEDGPTGAPDRVLDVLADRIAHQPQRPAWRLDWRHTMQPAFKIGVGIAAVVLVALVGWNLLPGGSAGIGGPGLTPTPTLSPSPTTSPPPLLPEGSLNAQDYLARALPGDPMAFTVTAPVGWTGFGGWAIYGPNGIGIAFMHGPQVTADPCDPAAREPSPAPTAPSVDELVASLSARRDLQVSGVTDTVLAGYSGKRLDVQLPVQFACGQHYVFAEPQGFYAQGPANRWRVWVLDAGGETAVVVFSDFAETLAADRAVAQAAIDSIRITR